MRITSKMECRIFHFDRMDEARKNDFQFSQMTSNLLRGTTVSTDFTSSPIRLRAPPKKRVKPVRPSKTLGLRPLETIVDSGAYRPSEYHPQPIKAHRDEEKDRLANLMAYGVDPNKIVVQPVEDEPSEIDRFDELVMEIDERKRFLEQMTQIGRGKEYQLMIRNEISEKVREMEQIDRERSKVLETRLKNLTKR